MLEFGLKFFIINRDGEKGKGKKKGMMTERLEFLKKKEMIIKPCRSFYLILYPNGKKFLRFSKLDILLRFSIEELDFLIHHRFYCIAEYGLVSIFKNDTAVILRDNIFEEWRIILQGKQKAVDSFAELEAYLALLKGMKNKRRGKFI